MKQNELRAYASPWRMALIVMGAVTFVALGLWMTGVFGELSPSRRMPPELVHILGWLSVFFFGACAIVGVRRAFDTKLQLCISEQGIYWKPWSGDTIPWHEIRDVGIWEYRRQKAIILHLIHPERYPSTTILGKLAAANRSITGGDISISLTGMNKSFDDALATIQEFRAA